MAKLKIGALLITVSVIFSSFMGCSKRKLAVDYRESSFIAVARMTDRTGELTAKVTSSRGCVYIELLTPDSLSGITLCREAFGDFILCGDLKVPSEQYAYLLEWLDVILPQGEIILTGKTSLDGSEALGAVIETESVEIYLDKSTYAPLKIIKKDRQISLISFDYTS